MQKYEITVLFDKKDKDIIEKVEKMLTSIKAKKVKKEDWGLKKLAYPIKKLTEANYVFFEAEIEQDKLADLAAKIKLEEGIIRSLIVKA